MTPLWLTLKVAGWATALALLSGVLMARLLAGRGFPGRDMLDAICTLPLVLRGILAGTMLAFARAMGEFGATLMIAGNLPGRTQTLSLAVCTGSKHPAV